MIDNGTHGDSCPTLSFDERGRGTRGNFDSGMSNKTPYQPPPAPPPHVLGRSSANSDFGNRSYAIRPLVQLFPSAATQKNCRMLRLPLLPKTSNPLRVLVKPISSAPKMLALSVWSTRPTFRRLYVPKKSTLVQAIPRTTAAPPAPAVCWALMVGSIAFLFRGIACQITMVSTRCRKLTAWDCRRSHHYAR
jgi:hypothetical protein